MTLRRIFAIAGTAIGALAVLYGVAWFVIADRLRNGIDRWVAERRAEGWTAEHGDIAIGGFPFHWVAHVQNPHLAQSARKPHFLWSGPSFNMSWVPWRAHVIDFRTAGTHRLGIGTATESRAIPVTMAQADGRLGFLKEGGVDTLSFTIDDISLPADKGETLQIGRIAYRIDAHPPAGDTPADQLHLKPAFRLSTTLSALILPAASNPALGRTVDRVGLRGTVLGPLPSGTVREVAAGWRDGGGTLEIEEIILNWSALQVRGDGTMALDNSLQPVGALTARITGFDATMDQLVTGGIVRSGEALLAKFALGALARPSKNGGAPEIRASVSIQDGWIYVGPVKLLPAPLIKWN
jgi:hypothetical protein